MFLPSSPPVNVRAYLPSGLKPTSETPPRCGKGGPMGVPVAASQSRPTLSPPPVRTVLPSGLKAAA